MMDNDTIALFEFELQDDEVKDSVGKALSARRTGASYDDRRFAVASTAPTDYGLTPQIQKALTPPPLRLTYRPAYPKYHLGKTYVSSQPYKERQES